AASARSRSARRSAPASRPQARLRIARSGSPPSTISIASSFRRTSPATRYQTDVARSWASTKVLPWPEAHDLGPSRLLAIDRRVADELPADQTRPDDLRDRRHGVLDIVARNIEDAVDLDPEPDTRCLACDAAGHGEIFVTRVGDRSRCTDRGCDFVTRHQDRDILADQIQGLLRWV